MFGRLFALSLSVSFFTVNSMAAEIPGQSVLMDKQLTVLPDGRSMNLVCTGQGSPTLVFENGLGGNLLHWQKVQPALSAITTTCFYDRAGYGFSDPALGPRTAKAAVDDLHALLAKAGIRSPVVLVGHSLGGLVSTLYTDLYPGQVAGLVLIDPSFAGQGNPARSAAGKANDQASYDQEQSESLRCASLAWKEKLTVSDPEGCFGAAPTRTAQEIDFLIYQYLRPYRYEAAFSELENMSAASPGEDVDSQEEQSNARSFGNKPVVVLTAGQGDAGDPEQQRRWKEGHDRLAARSSAGRSVVVSGSGHYIQVEQPDAVIAAVREVVAEVRQQVR